MTPSTGHAGESDGATADHGHHARRGSLAGVLVVTLAVLAGTGSLPMVPVPGGSARDVRSEEPTATTEGARYSFTADLGVYHAVTGLHGDIMIPEDRLKAAVVRAALDGSPLELEIDKLLGRAWDDELEPFRHAGDGAPVRWLHQVV